MENKKDEKGFSLGRLDIVDLYEWKTAEKLVYQTYFQRQFVWKEKDKKDLIDTIVKGLPIPAIFICDARTDFSSLSKTYNVLDGRQRLESIFEFLENQYQYNGQYFKDMDEDTKKSILNYNITLIQMYISPDDTDRIKEIFKRLNKNSYNLNRIEKQSTQLVEYDYMIIAKIVSGIIQFENIESYLDEIQELFASDEDTQEEKGEIVELQNGQENSESIPNEIKEICCMSNIKYIHEILTGDYVFKTYDRQRQIALQYFLNIFSCIMTGEIINRNVNEKTIIELSDLPKNTIEEKLKVCNTVCERLLEIYQEDINDFWKNKASFFSLMYLLATKPEILKITVDEMVERLNAFYDSESETWHEYYEASNQGVNDRKARELRNDILSKILS